MIIIPWHNCLVLAKNICVGYQAAFLLRSVGWGAEVALDLEDSIRHLNSKAFDTIVIDVGDNWTSGEAVLAWNRLRRRSIAAYAICSPDDKKAMYLANSFGCLGIFYQPLGRLEIDVRTGMGAMMNSFVANLPES